MLASEMERQEKDKIIVCAEHYGIRGTKNERGGGIHYETSCFDGSPI